MGCSSGDSAQTGAAGPGGSTTVSSSSAGGSGGTGGGVVMDQVCVTSPVAAALPGTDDCPAPMPAVADAFDDALAAGGIDRCKVRFLPDDVKLSGWPMDMLFDKHRLPDFTALHRGPLRLPGYARETRDWLDAAGASKNPVSGVIAALSVRRGHAFMNACADLAPFLPATSDMAPLATATILLAKNQGGSVDDAAVTDAASKLPIALQKKLARVIGALDFAATEVKAALGTSDAKTIKYFSQSYSIYVPQVFAWDLKQASVKKLDSVDVGRMSEAAAILAKTIEDADFQSEPNEKFPAFEVKTPIGAIVVHDSANDTYKKGSAADGAALLFDLGGDDTYQVGCGVGDDKHPASVAIDVRGSDSYGYFEKPNINDGDLLVSDASGRYTPQGPPDMYYGPITLSRTPRQGVGLAGIGMLFDLGSEKDTYKSLAISQGFAASGVGILFDAGGDDTYDAEVASQGAATFGIGALVDLSGNDQYHSFANSQGFGGSQGAGALIDLDGDDVYFVDPGDPMIGGHPLYFTPQLPGKGNSSMSQGAAQGLRPPSDPNVDQAYLAGGIGILRDKRGADHYTGSVFAQGIAYWQGLGMLIDSAGDDTYDALWYIQGSTAHFSLSIFLEEGGDDLYNATFPPVATSIGVGHDFSASVHLDLGGNDEYHAPGLSLGSGNINGIGCLVNVGGDDKYIAAGDPTFGAGNYSSEAPYGAARQKAPTIGIFVDAGGNDTYEVGGMARALDGTTWSYEPQPYPDPMTMMVTTENGCGNDSNTKTATLP